MFRRFLTLAIFLATFSSSFAEDLYFPTFREGLCRNGRSESYYKKRIIHQKNKVKRNHCEYLETLYTDIYQNSLEKLLNPPQDDVDKIPKVIHVIWLGSPLPEKYAEWQQTWKDMDGWEYRLWTDSEVADLVLVNRDLYDSLKGYGEKSDLLRYEILYQFGGLYVDTDFACFNPEYFEAFHHSLDFYIGLAPIEWVPFRFGNAILGSSPNHEFLGELLAELPENYKRHKGNSPMFTTGTAFFTKIMEDFLSRADDNRDLVTIFPTSFFYPFTKEELVHEFKNNLSAIHHENMAKESCAIHFWDGSWIRNKVRKICD